MYDAFSRMEILMGTRAVNRLGSAKIAVFGIGGAGSYVVEALARCGVGSLTLVDHKDIVQSDINRQLYAGQSTVGRKKVQTAKEHIRDIDENILMKHIIMKKLRECLICSPLTILWMPWMYQHPKCS